jgi:hypothetical protein
MALFTEACRAAEDRVCALLIERGWLSGRTRKARLPAGFSVAKCYADGERIGLFHPRNLLSAELLLPIDTPPHDAVGAIQRFVQQDIATPATAGITEAG